MPLVRLEVVVGPVRDPFQLSPVREREAVLDVDRPLRVVRELVGIVVARPEVVRPDPQVGEPA